MQEGSHGILVSITFPIHKVNEFAEQALNSLLNQSYQHIEIMFLDNSLTGLHNCFDFTDQRIRYFKLPPDFGLAETLNFAIDNAKGKYLARMDYDDISLPSRILEQVRFMEENANIVISGTNIVVIGKAIDSNVEPGQEVKRKFVHNEITYGLLANNAFFHPTVIFRLDDLKKAKLRYRKAYDSAEDLDLWCRASRVVKLANLDKALVLYRVHANQYSRLDGHTSNFKANRVRIWHSLWLMRTRQIPLILGLKICIKLVFRSVELWDRKRKTNFSKL
jgi:glycosyltransferase involved in cell wall biosynthesis